MGTQLVLWLFSVPINELRPRIAPPTPLYLRF